MMPIQPTLESEQVELDKARRELLARAYALILSPAWSAPQAANNPTDAPDGAPAGAESAQSHDE